MKNDTARKRPGRPKKEASKVKISITLDPAIYEKVKKECARTGASVSHVIERSLRCYDPKACDKTMR